MRPKYGVVIATYGDVVWKDKAQFAARSAEVAGADVIVLHHDVDLATARNVGASKLDTDFVTFLDADDLLDSNFFNRLDDYTDLSQSLLYKPQTIGVYPDGSFDATPSFIRSDQPLAYTNSLVIGTSMRLSDFNATKGFDPSLPALEDWDLFLRVYRNGAEIVECDGVIYIVSINPHGRNANKENQRFACREIRRRYAN